MAADAEVLVVGDGPVAAALSRELERHRVRVGRGDRDGGQAPAWLCLCDGAAAPASAGRAGAVFSVGSEADALNLAWKLGLVARGRAGAALLDSYQVERASDGDYRESPIVAEHRTSLFDQRLLDDEKEESATLRAARRFAAAPAAGERAPELGDLHDGLRHTLLLFDGRAATDDGYRQLDWLARRVRADYDDVIAVHIVVPHAERPAALLWDGSLVLDAEEALSERFGALAECLYLIRPDGYVGYRSQPADEAELMGFLRDYLSEVAS